MRAMLDLELDPADARGEPAEVQRTVVAEHDELARPARKIRSPKRLT